MAKGNFVSSDFVKGSYRCGITSASSAVVFAQEDDSCLIVRKQKGRLGHAGCCTKRQPPVTFKRPFGKGKNAMKLYVVGIGPGELSQITPAAMAAMEESDVIAGYTVYVDLVRVAFLFRQANS